MVELEIQKMTIATEMKYQNKKLYDYMMEIARKNNIDVKEVPHEQFKEGTKFCKAIIRTGECKPYSNVILESGVVFGK